MSKVECVIPGYCTVMRRDCLSVHYTVFTLTWGELFRLSQHPLLVPPSPASASFVSLCRHCRDEPRTLLASTLCFSLVPLSPFIPVTLSPALFKDFSFCTTPSVCYRGRVSRVPVCGEGRAPYKTVPIRGTPIL